MAEAPAGQRSPRRHLGQHAAGSGRAEHPDALAWPREGAGGARSAGAGGGRCRGRAGWGGQRTRGRCWVLCPLSLPCADSPLSLTGIPFYTHLPGVTAPTAAGLARCRRGLPCTSCCPSPASPPRTTTLSLTLRVIGLFLCHMSSNLRGPWGQRAMTLFLAMFSAPRALPST